jgi:molybdopterin-containing oxidoreductase family iron-sulfur binding subunit
VSARVFGDIKDSESPISKFLRERDTFRIREDWGTSPKVHYVRPEKQEA